MTSSPEGILVVDKEIGPTSHDVVAALRSAIGVRRIGHCGTLDPLASGVLVACVGGFTRLSQWLSDGVKEYDASLILGATSNTYDAQGEIVTSSPAKTPSIGEVYAGLATFVGTIEQVPPAFSAVKVNGVRSYKLARADRAVDLQPRTVTIDAIDVLSYEYPGLELRISCHKGTYVRSLAADLGDIFGCGAYVDGLRRTRVGAMGLEMALTVDEIRDAAAAGTLERHFVAPHEALRELRAVVLEEVGLERFAHGNQVEVESSGWTEDSAVCAIYDPRMHLYGIGEWSKPGCSLQPLKVVRTFASRAVLKMQYDTRQ